jgi:hypothetical protein
MPQLIGVKLLSQTCLDFVINNMAVMCEKLPKADFATTTSNQTSQSPFDHLCKLPTKYYD